MLKLKIVVMAAVALVSVAALALQSTSYRLAQAKVGASTGVAQGVSGHVADLSNNESAPEGFQDAKTAVRLVPESAVASSPGSGDIAQTSNGGNQDTSSNENLNISVSNSNTTSTDGNAKPSGSYMCPKDAAVCYGPLEPPICNQIDGSNNLEPYDPLYRIPPCHGPIDSCNYCYTGGGLNCPDVAICAEP